MPDPTPSSSSPRVPVFGPGHRLADDPDAVPISPAATVMLVRDGGSGLEVFMLRRSASAAFAGGIYVFPGGRVDDADAAVEIEPFCSGLDDGVASSMLGVERGGLAFWVAAIRECFEEAGVLIGHARNGSRIELSDDERHQVHDGTLSMAELCRRHDLVLDTGSVHYVAHWLTPWGEVRRFDTRFFLAASPEGQDPLHDDTETVASLWIKPGDALDAAAAGELLLLPPTLATLTSLRQHADIASAFDAAQRAGRPERIEPRLRFDDAGELAGISLPDDPDYDSLT